MTSDRMRRWCGMALLLAALLYAAWLLEWWLSPEADRVHGYVSELAARDQAFSWLYRCTDMAAGLLVLFAAWGCQRRLPWAWALLAVFGVSTILDAVFAMECAPSIDVACAGKGNDVADLGHLLTSSVANTALVIATVVFAVWVPWRGWARQFFFAASLLVVALTLMTVAAMAIDEWLGVLQRGSVLVMSVWLGVLGLVVLRDWRVGRESPNTACAVSVGVGEPVVFSSGLGGAQFDWKFVIKHLAAENYCCTTFDRPGLGCSAMTWSPQSLRHEVDRIARLAPRTHKRVLVGHSLAALHVEAYARWHPRDIAGIVLVDPSWEPHMRHRRWWLKPWAEMCIWAAPLFRGVLACTGLARLVGPKVRAGTVARMSHSRRESGTPQEVRAAYGRASCAMAAMVENIRYRDWSADLVRLRRERPFPNVPVVVIAALGGLSRDDAKKWEDDLGDLVRLLGGKRITLPEARHLTFLDAPAVIASAIAEVSSVR